MKVLQSSRNFFAILGVDLNQPIQKNPFGAKNVAVIFILCMGFVLSGVYFLHVAEEFLQFANSIYTTTIMMAVAIIFTTGVVRISILSEHIEHLQEIIDQRELFLRICFN